MEKLLASEIEAGNKVKAVCEVVKTYKTQKQDMYDETAEILKPSIDVQKNIDEKQDKVIKQLQENQKALTEGIDKISEANLRAITFEEELPKSIEAPHEMEPIKLNVENIFNKNDKTILNNYKLTKPRDLTQISPQKLLEEKEKSIKVARIIGMKKKNASHEDKIS